jgi:GTPase SAR1 family protein
LVFDLTRFETFLNLGNWIKDVREKGEKNIVILLIGNKLDICAQDPSKRQVTLE